MRIFKVMFVNQGKVYEVYAKSVHQGELYGFLEVEGLIFGNTGGIVVDPAEERLKSEFQGVIRSMIPIHAVIRIDEVRQEGQSKIHDSEAGANVTPFPSPFYTQDKGPHK